MERADGVLSQTQQRLSKKKKEKEGAEADLPAHLKAFIDSVNRETSKSSSSPVFYGLFLAAPPKQSAPYYKGMSPPPIYLFDGAKERGSRKEYDPFRFFSQTENFDPLAQKYLASNDNSNQKEQESAFPKPSLNGGLERKIDDAA